MLEKSGCAIQNTMWATATNAIAKRKGEGFLHGLWVAAFCACVFITWHVCILLQVEDWPKGIFLRARFACPQPQI